MIRVASRQLVLGSFLMAGVACADSPTAPEAVVQQENISAPAIVGSMTTILVQEKYALRADAQVSRARTVRWKSSNNSVATVNGHGVVDGGAPGTAYITATGTAGTTQRFDIQVVKLGSVEVASAKGTLVVGEKTSAQVTLRSSDGLEVESRYPVTWSVASGSAVSVSSSGEITAVAPGSATIAATVEGKTGAAMITVSGGASNPEATVTSYQLNPGSAQLAAEGTVQFATAATWSDGADRPVETTYEATGGTIDLAGLYRAGTTAGTYSVIATCSCGKKDTAIITVAAPAAPTLTSLTISPKAVALLVGATQQFAVAPVWSDGATRATSVTWAAVDGGTVSSAGLFTAPSSSGSYRVVVSHSGGTKKDTAVVNVSQPGSLPSFATPAPPTSFVNLTYPNRTGVVRNVSAGSNLQAVLDAAQPGDEIVLANGAVFTDNYILPAKSGSGSIVIRSATVPVASGVRITPGTAAGIAKIVTPNYAAAIRTAPGAKNWRLVGIEVTQAPGLAMNYGIVVLGQGNESTLELQPSNIVLDRVYIHGQTNDNTQRCVAFNGRHMAVIDSWLSDCHGKGFDSQGIVGWAGGGPFHIENNHIEGAGQNIMFGGADPVIQNVSPSDIIIRRNHLYKPLSWGNGKWTVKATFELKHAKRVIFEGNILENHWANAQVGYAILFQVVSDEGPAWSWTTIQDVTVRNNIIIKSTSGVNLLSRAQYTSNPLPPNPMTRVLVVNNLFRDVGKDPFSGDAGKMLQLLSDLSDITILNNTMVASNVVSNAVSFDGPAQQRLILINNIFPNTYYGIHGSGVGVGSSALNHYAPGAIVSGNVFPGQQANIYPANNFFPELSSSILFTSAATGDFSLTVANPFYSGSNGRIGIDAAALNAATLNVRSPL